MAGGNGGGKVRCWVGVGFAGLLVRVFWGSLGDGGGV